MQDRNSLAQETAKSGCRTDFSHSWSQDPKQNHELFSLPPCLALLISMLQLFLDRLTLHSSQDAACSFRSTSHHVRKCTRGSIPFSSIDYSFCGNKRRPPNKNQGYLFSVCYSKRVSDLHLLLVETQRQAE